MLWLQLSAADPEGPQQQDKPQGRGERALETHQKSWTTTGDHDANFAASEPAQR